MKAFVTSVCYSCVIGLLISTASLAEDIYRWETPDGTTVYSDKPQPNVPATKINQPLAPTIHLQNVKISDIPKKVAHPEANQYKTITITSPQNDTVFHAPVDRMLVSATVNPSLKPEHAIRFLKNGSPLGTASQKDSATLENLERGSHILRAQVVDRAGKVLIHSQPITIHIKQPTVK